MKVAVNNISRSVATLRKILLNLRKLMDATGKIENIRIYTKKRYDGVFASNAIIDLHI